MENVENVCIPSRPQAQLAEDYKIDSPKSYSSDRQEDTSALLENDESMSDNVVTEADFIQCAGQLGSLITHMALMKQNMMKCTVASPEAFLVDAKEAAQSCKKIAARLEKSVESALSKRDKEKVAILESDLPESVPSDPGLRPPNMTKSQIEYLAQIGPQQPKLFNYPQDKEIKGNHKQNRFCAAWYSQYPFLEYSIEKDAVFCFVCQMFPYGPDRERSEQNWCTTGVKKWDKMKSRGVGKPGKLSEHFSSKAHKASLSDYVQFMSNNSRIDTLLDKEIRAKAIQIEEDTKNNRSVIKIIIDLCRTMARQGISFRGSQSDADGNFTQLLSLLSRHCPKLNQWMNDKHKRAYKVTYTSPQSQNEFLSLLGSEVENRITKEINDADVFSIMADTTPDVSQKDQMSVICRYVDVNGGVRERVIDIKEVRDKTGEGQASAVIQSVDNKGLDNARITFQSYDFTNSMSGQYNGMQAKVSQQLGREVPYIPLMNTLAQLAPLFQSYSTHFKQRMLFSPAVQRGTVF